MSDVFDLDANDLFDINGGTDEFSSPFVLKPHEEEKSLTMKSKDRSGIYHVCDVERCISQIGFIFDLFYRNAEYNISTMKIIQKIMNNSFSRKMFGYDNSKHLSNLASSYILQLIDYYLMDIEQNKIIGEKFRHIETMECYIRMLNLIDVAKEDYTFDYAKICN
jgi:hypothetical protein